MTSNIVVLYVILVLLDITTVGLVIVITLLAVDNIDTIKSFFQEVKGKFYDK